MQNTLYEKDNCDSVTDILTFTGNRIHFTGCPPTSQYDVCLGWYRSQNKAIANACDVTDFYTTHDIIKTDLSQDEVELLQETASEVSDFSGTVYEFDFTTFCKGPCHGCTKSVS